MNDYRQIPSVDLIINSPEASPIIANFGRSQVIDAIRAVQESLRQIDKLDRQSCTAEAILIRANLHLQKNFKATLIPLINASGVILHTNLGRAPLSDDSIEAMATIASNYNSLEFDLSTGKRGSRTVHAEKILMQLTGAEAALVVNNNASAILVILSTLAYRRRVIISRSQLIEIGGGFRIPDVMKQSGAKLIEIGTTNRTHLNDYSTALQEPAALVMRAHHSNFKIIGFFAEPNLAEICEAAHTAGVPVLDDLGSGTFLDTAQYGLQHEPTISESLSAGADLVCFSGDKLLGGPQAGIIIGRKQLIDKIKKHPLVRAIRADKLCLAGLTATLNHYLRDEAEQEIPIWKMISRSAEDIQLSAHAWQRTIQHGDVINCRSTIGGGSMPEETLPSYALSFTVRNPDQFVKQLRQFPIPIIARIENEKVLLDPRTVFSVQEEVLCNQIKTLFPE
ncbi:MAG: L-seryl-tRNA(Sec) selenium transferase [Chloroflexi bacterium 44-23]|nr:MAG: L-seryl-tRNA(Sec) selenium transferase [Chloroflexi bacterium 44-23]